MWQPQQYQNPGPYQFNQYPVQVQTSTFNPNPNASIDLVVTQVETLANQINTLTNDGESAGLQIADRGVETWVRMRDGFQNVTLQNIDHIAEVANEKFGNWPVTELIVMVIVGVVLVVITLVFLFMLFGERITAYRYRKKLSADSDIENI